MRVTSFDFLKLLITLTLFALIQSRPNTKKSRYTHCFASESITGIYGLGKSWPQTDLDPLSHNAPFLPYHLCFFFTKHSPPNNDVGQTTREAHSPQRSVVCP